MAGFVKALQITTDCDAEPLALGGAGLQKLFRQLNELYGKSGL